MMNDQMDSPHAGISAHSESTENDQALTKSATTILALDDLPAVAKFDEADIAPSTEPMPVRDDALPITTDNVIPLPPTSAMYDSYNELYTFLQQFHRRNGAALAVRRSGSPQMVNGKMTYCYITLGCDRGEKRASRSVGVRKSSTQRLDCPVTIVAKTGKGKGWKWLYEVRGEHNHRPSLSPSAHAIHRHRTVNQQDLIKNLFEQPALPAREMGSIVRDQTNEKSFFIPKDIYNDRQALRRTMLDGLTATQAWIKILQDQNLRHTIHYDADNRVESVFWTYPWCEKMWSQFPQVIGLDNTYKTNRFKMFLFQVTGVTDQKSVANLAFGLVRTEKTEGFEWLARRLNEFRLSLAIASPSVLITDKDMALKNALASVFPSSQQQLCIFHINAHIKSRIKSQWRQQQKTSGIGLEKERDQYDVENLTEIEELFAAKESGLEASASTLPDYQGHSSGTIQTGNSSFGINSCAEASGRFQDCLQPTVQLIEDGSNAADAFAALDPEQPDELSRETMFKAWLNVMYAGSEACFEDAWLKMVSTYGPMQGFIVAYISSEYMPWRHQWAKCYIDRYQNFGQRTNSPTETANQDVKSFLVTGTGDLLHLHTAIVQMLAKKDREYTHRAARMEMKQRRDFLGRNWLGQVSTEASYVAIDLNVQQHRSYEVSTTAPSRPCPLEWESETMHASFHVLLSFLSALGAYRSTGTWAMICCMYICIYVHT